jgi:hypothetical protein
LQQKALAKQAIEAIRQQKRGEKEDTKAQQVIDSLLWLREQLKSY